MKIILVCNSSSSLFSCEFLVSWKCHLHSNIYTPTVFIPAMHRTNQGQVQHGVAVEPTIHLWIHVGRIV